MPATADRAAMAEPQDLLMIEGMFCAACAASLERRLARLPGVVEAAVDLAAGAALLRWLPGKQDLSGARRAVAALGYVARGPGEASAAEGAGPDAARALQIRLAVALFFGMWTMLPSIALYLDAAPDAAVARALACSAGVASLPVVLYSGSPFYSMALATLRGGVAGIDALVAFGVLGAILLSLLSLLGGASDVYFEVAVALITLQLIARLVERRVLRAGRDAVALMLDLVPPRVTRLDARQFAERVSVDVLSPGDILLAEPGETLAVDGVAQPCDATIDRSVLTGESVPLRVRAGDAVRAGERVVEGPLRFRIGAVRGERRIDALGRQIRTLLLRKSRWQRGVDAVARHFLLLACLAAGIGALLAAASGADAIATAERSLAVFVIACPCALSLAAPLTALGASRRAAGSGMLLCDLQTIIGIGRIDTLFVDKTGTLTEGTPRVRALRPSDGVDAKDLLAVAAAVEQHSRHPLAVAIVRAAQEAGLDANPWALPGEAPLRRTLVGRGISVDDDGTTLRAGSSAWFAEEGLDCETVENEGTSRVWVARGDRVLGAIDLDDPPRAGVREAIELLKRAGIEVTLLSGDASEPVARMSAYFGIKGVAECSPEDKVRHVEDATARGRVTAFVGDGINDGPAIAAARLGVAVDGASDAAKTAAAVTLARGGMERVPALLALLASTRRVLRRNVGGAILYNAVAVPAALVGWVHPAVAALAMAASSLTVVLNSLTVRGTPEN